jgi:TolA-binding protein
MRAFFYLILGSLAFSSLSCATRLDDVDESISDLQKRTALLEQKSGMPIGSDRELLDGQRLADVRTQVAALRNEITVMSGRVETLEFERKQLAEGLAAAEARVSALERAQRQPQQDLGDGGGVAPGSEGLYKEALRAFQDGDFQRAETLFQDFAKRYPKDSLADNALFWLGESFMARKMYKNAVTHLQDLIERYPRSDMKCAAMKNQITCLKELGMEKEATAFQKVRNAECQNQN